MSNLINSINTINAAKKLGWRVDIQDDAVTFENFSPAGEDIVIECRPENITEDLKSYILNFDIDEHIEMWLRFKIECQRKNIPSARALCEDAEKIDEMLRALLGAITK